MESFRTRHLPTTKERDQAPILTSEKISDLIQSSLIMFEVATSGINLKGKRLSPQGRQSLYRESLLNAIVSLQEIHRLGLAITSEALSQIDRIISGPEPEFNLDTV